MTIINARCFTTPYGKVRSIDSNECTHLHLFADNKDLLAVLLDYADGLEVRDGLNWTLLTTAVQRGSKDNVQLLLERGANIDCDAAHGMNLIATAMCFHQIGRQQFPSDSYGRYLFPSFVR